MSSDSKTSGPGKDAAAAAAAPTFDDMEATPVQVKNVFIEGAQRTKPDVLAFHIRKVLTAGNLAQVVEAAVQTQNSLCRLGVFHNGISAFIDTYKVPGSAPNDLDVTFRVRERKRSASLNLGYNMLGPEGVSCCFFECFLML